MPAHPDAIEAARITRHRRYIDLCDPDHPDYNPAYLPVVAGILAQNDARTATQSPGNSHQIAVKRPSNDARTAQGRRNIQDCPARYKLVPD